MTISKPKIKIKKNDLVQVISGKDRGLQGRVISVDTERQRVLVEGVNRITKHVKAGQPSNNSNGTEDTEAPIHVSNVQVIDPEIKKPTRIRIREEKMERDGRTKTVRTRVSVRSGKDL